MRIANLKFLLLFAASLALLSGFANASGCGTLPSGISSLITACIPVNVLNLQSAATPSGFQQQLSNLPINALAGNFVVYNSLSGSLMPTWVESNSMAWVNFGTNTIGATTNAIGVYYLGLGSSGTNFFISGNDIGEAPQLSSTYAQYDNGASVFPTLYQNFAGTSVPSGWTNSGFTINNGFTTGASGYLITSTSLFGLSANVLEFYGNVLAGSNANTGTGYTGPTAWAAAGSDAVVWGGYSGPSFCNSALACGATSLSGTASVETSLYGLTTNAVYSIYWPSSTSASFQVNYGANAVITTEIPTNTETIGSAQSTSDEQSVTWMRIRAYPPDGVMPTVQYGSPQSSSSLSLSITPNPAPYGTQVQITLTPTPSTDGSNIIFQGSTVLTGTGTITYNALGTPIAISNALAAGTYTVNGCDTTLNTCAGNTILTVSTANVPITCTRNGQSIAAGALYNSLLANALTSCTFQSLGNQIIGNIIRNGADLVSGSAPSTTQDWDNQLNAWVANTFATGNYASNSLSWSVNDIPYSLLSATLPAAQGYETQAQSLSYDINFTKAAANVLVTFGVNGIAEATNSVTVASTDQVFPFSYTNPLVAANNIMQSVFTVNALLHFGGSYASYDPILTPALNTLTQNVLWNYYPQLSSISPSPAIQGDNITVNMLISQVNPLSAVSVAGNLKVGNQTLTEAVTSAYHYQTVMHSFVNSHYALTMPTVGTPVTVGANAIFQLTYNGVTLYRNASESTFSTYLESLGTCGTTNYATNTLLWTFYNGTKPSKVWTPNVLLSGFYTIVRNLYQSNAISGTSAGFTSTATSNTYETCIYPSWAKFNVSATTQYNSTNTVLSNYYLNQLPLSNTLTTLQLYLNLEPNPIQYEIFVQNGSTLNYIPALVKVLLYNVNTNSSTLVNELKTQANSGVFTLLNNQSFYQFQAFTPDGKTLLATTNYYQAVPCSTAACEFTIVVGNFNVTLPSTVFKNVQSGCTTVAGSGNTMTVSCTFTSLNGATYNTSLNVTYGQVLNHASVCEKSVVSGSASLDCTVSNTNSTQYYYAYSLYYGGTWYVLAHGYVGLQASLFGQDGAWFALLVVVTLVLLFLSRNVTFAIVLFDVGFVLVSLIGLVYVPLTILGFELAASAVVLYVANRGVG